MSPPTSGFELIATTAFGLEAVVVRELRALGYEGRTMRPGRIVFRGDPLAICRTNLWLRCAERVVLHMGTFPARDFDQLFEATLAIPWQQWIPPDAKLPVRGRSRKSQLTSVPACQRTVKKALVEKLRAAHAVDQLPETGPVCAVEIELLEDLGTLTLDTTGTGLHKRGYRTYVDAAPLRETLAAALVQLSFWNPDRPLLDPFCGTGTIPIEAALIGHRLAPGRDRSFAAEAWPTLDPQAWHQARQEARDLARQEIPERIIGTDVRRDVLRLARHHAQQAGVSESIHFQQRPFDQLRSQRPFGCLITNPPYGQRMGHDAEIEALYRAFPDVLRRLPTWSHYVLTARPDFEELVGQAANRRRKLYNGRIACTYFQFHGPHPASGLQPDRAAEVSSPSTSAASEPLAHASPAPRPAFGGLRPESSRQAEQFANRLRKRARHLRRWPTRRAITCYRLYDRDIPEVPLAIDRYEDVLHIAEYVRPHDRTPAEHADWLDLMVKTASQVLEVPPKHVFVKRRTRQQGTGQYQRLANQKVTRIVQEGGLRFRINLSDYLDPGLFLDHRITRAWFRDAARDRRVLNLFAYTGSFSVYAAAGGAASTTTVDLLPTHLDWARENMLLNGYQENRHHRFVRADARNYLASLPAGVTFDLAIVDPPTFSNSKRVPRDWDVQRDHVELLNQLSAHLAPGGTVYFSTNFRRFRLDVASLDGLEAHEISRQTVPEDFQNRRIHRCWKLRRTDKSS